MTRGLGNTIPTSAQLADITAKSEYGILNDIGGSTLPMTIFNWTNMLVGVGTLSLGLGLQQCRWTVGLTLLTLPALVTVYTANLLAMCLNIDSSVFAYGDIASLAYSSSGRNLIEVLFASGAPCSERSTLRLICRFLQRPHSFPGSKYLQNRYCNMHDASKLRPLQSSQYH
ncbi:uncharacterized protein A1O9_03579 [Exophiala aquamarina CBS 119918]|uniref:Amino acid transporter transmembrane domain-containing protein n=1 Tax=Exophiala aquamarina CBS 119918 TaxID=1182545 RepID=A0A072PQH7_9EURO|nr:uncharacterized protein A1O9_03579 [Exophiala aquamarina CBS 119918]KEF62007.1 hypothetical protein A1O9_03579 [Exophiala aquamarina CBS 119918]